MRWFDFLMILSGIALSALWTTKGGRALFLGFWARLKGSRDTLHFRRGTVLSAMKAEISYTLAKLRGKAERDFMVSGSVLELARGWFRKRTAIYGRASRFWRVKEVSWNEYGNARVHLMDIFGLEPEMAFRAFNRYETLQSMVEDFEQAKSELELVRERNEEFRKRCTGQAERIVELEELVFSKDVELKEFSEALEQRAGELANLFGAVNALHAQILSDKPDFNVRHSNRYRSKVVQEIRKDLEEILLHFPMSAKTKNL